jgi:FtsH-binding integral membrane protein
MNRLPSIFLAITAAFFGGMSIITMAEAISVGQFRNVLAIAIPVLALFIIATLALALKASRE